MNGRSPWRAFAGLPCGTEPGLQAGFPARGFFDLGASQPPRPSGTCRRAGLRASGPPASFRPVCQPPADWQLHAGSPGSGEFAGFGRVRQVPRGWPGRGGLTGRRSGGCGEAVERPGVFGEREGSAKMAGVARGGAGGRSFCGGGLGLPGGRIGSRFKRRAGFVRNGKRLTARETACWCWEGESDCCGVCLPSGTAFWADVMALE